MKTKVVMIEVYGMTRTRKEKETRMIVGQTVGVRCDSETLAEMVNTAVKATGMTVSDICRRAMECGIVTALQLLTGTMEEAEREKLEARARLQKMLKEGNPPKPLGVVEEAIEKLQAARKGVGSKR